MAVCRYGRAARECRRETSQCTNLSCVLTHCGCCSNQLYRGPARVDVKLHWFPGEPTNHARVWSTVAHIGSPSSQTGDLNANVRGESGSRNRTYRPPSQRRALTGDQPGHLGQVSRLSSDERHAEWPSVHEHQELRMRRLRPSVGGGDRVLVENHSGHVAPSPTPRPSRLAPLLRITPREGQARNSCATAAKHRVWTRVPSSSTIGSRRGNGREALHRGHG
jgi:hypothetical protein